MLNTTFAGLAFVGVICALSQQQNQIKQQARDLKEQNRRIDLQQFENFFYKQVEFLEYLSKNIRSGNFVGDRAISEIKKSVVFCFPIVHETCGGCLAVQPQDKIDEYNRKWCTFDNAHNDMLPWINKFYSLIHYIRNHSLLEQSEKQFYINIVFGILSADQKYMIQLMGCISFSEKYPILEKFLEEEKFFPVTSNLIFKGDKNINTFKKGLGFGMRWFDYMKAIADGRKTNG
ncbi:hypothetical protein CXU22_05675 [Akkermansia muciniphila]|uniref:Uncharacterized protein n=1 Tax=Akkermansia muciniphila TaxID=239935 RepID=A0A2N8HDS0_9BACT|nr:hypothetical protein [Akkermansia muciniphila]PNC18126.1 hypothetical protein CXU22_05675 [Akkermansia muciniphila]